MFILDFHISFLTKCVLQPLIYIWSEHFHKQFSQCKGWNLFSCPRFIARFSTEYTCLKKSLDKITRSPDPSP